MPNDRPITPAADFLADAGKFLYGKADWLGPFAADLDVKPSWLHNCLKGRAKLLGNHPVLKRALRLVEERLEQQRDGWRARVEELEDAAMPDTPANDDGITDNRTIVVRTRQEHHASLGEPAKVRRHK